MPPPVCVNISHDARIIAGSSFNLTCIVLLNEKIDISVSVITKWDGPNGTLFNQIMTDHEMMSASIAKVNAARNGTYTCQATINPNPESEFITSSDSVTGSAIILVGKYCCVCILAAASS